MRKKIVAGNWKMNGRLETTSQLCQELAQELSVLATTVECVVFPPAIFISLVQTYFEETAIQWGGQNIYPAPQGAYTGEHSVLMLQDYGCHYVLVGHSERRQLFGETEKIIAEKFHIIKEHDMIPVLCVGETLEQRLSGQTEQVIRQQLQGLLAHNARAFEHAVIAYEPVWAIGTGQTATPEQVQAVHCYIRSLIAEYSDIDAENLSILYGGSVNDKNAKALFAMPDVDGGLVGGASMNAAQFVEIVQCII